MKRIKIIGKNKQKNVSNRKRTSLFYATLDDTSSIKGKEFLAQCVFCI